MRRILSGLVMSALMLVGGLGMVPVMAEGDLCEDFKDNPELAEAAGCNTTKKADSVINTVIEIVLAIMGVVAVGVMIYGGYLYMTSIGDASKAKRARDVILYGLVGLVVALLAFAIVSLVGTSVPMPE